MAQQVCNSGVSTYTDLFQAFDRAAKRMEAVSGAGTSDSIVNKLPLSPEDASVLQQAAAMGWDTCHSWNVFHACCSCFLVLLVVVVVAAVVVLVLVLLLLLLLVVLLLLLLLLVVLSLQVLHLTLLSGSYMDGCQGQEGHTT